MPTDEQQLIWCRQALPRLDRWEALFLERNMFDAVGWTRSVRKKVQLKIDELIAIRQLKEDHAVQHKLY